MTVDSNKPFACVVFNLFLIYQIWAIKYDNLKQLLILFTW